MRIGISQRVDEIKAYGEFRDALDQNWMPFLESAKITAVPIPNNLSDPVTFFKSMELEGLLLTGGNDIAKLPDAKNASKNRDSTETQLIEYATDLNLPIIGVCRGLQMLATVSGEKLSPLRNHVALRHQVEFIQLGDIVKFEVNSFHNWGINSLNSDGPWKAIAKAMDGSTEAIQHKTKPIIGIMWHPERESSFSSFDINLFKDHFSK